MLLIPKPYFWIYTNLFQTYFPFLDVDVPRSIYYGVYISQQMTQIFLRNTRFNFEIWVIFGQSLRMTLTFDAHLTSLNHLVDC